MQDNDNCWGTLVVRNVECGCVFKIEIIIVCFFDREG